MTGVIWVVRAGREARFAGEFLAEGHIAVGFRDVATDDASVIDEAALRGRAHDRRTRAAAGQLVAFAHRMQPDDVVITSRIQQSGDYLVGRVGAYEHRLDDPASGPHRRPVRWLGTFSREDVSLEALNTLGSIMTVFRPSAVEAELRSVITRLRPLGPGVDAQPVTVPSESQDGRAPAPSIQPGPAADNDRIVEGASYSPADVDVRVDEAGRATIVCHHPALVMEQTPRHLTPGSEWDGAPGIYVLTGTQLEHSAVRTGVERTLTTTLIVRPWAYVGLSEDFRGRLGSHRQAKQEWRRALLVRSAAQPFSSDDIRYLEREVHRAIQATGEVALDQTTPRGNLSAQPRNTALLDACAATVLAVLRLTGTLI